MYEDGLARSSLRALKERAVCGRVRRKDARALSERDLRGQLVNLRLVTQSEFRISARQTSSGVDAVSDAEARDAFADRFNRASGVEPRRVWKLWLDSVHARSYVRIDRINSD